MVLVAMKMAFFLMLFFVNPYQSELILILINNKNRSQYSMQIHEPLGEKLPQSKLCIAVTFSFFGRIKCSSASQNFLSQYKYANRWGRNDPNASLVSRCWLKGQAQGGRGTNTRTVGVEMTPTQVLCRELGYKIRLRVGAAQIREPLGQK